MPSSAVASWLDATSVLVKVVADSHAIVWYVQGSARLSEDAAATLAAAEASDGIVVSVATLIDLWYVTQTTRAVSADDVARLRSRLSSSPKVDLHPVDVAVADATTAIARDVITDPWDRFIVATARALELPLVTRDGSIHGAKLVETVW